MIALDKPISFDSEAFANLAESIYKERYQTEFEKLYKDKIVAIEIESGDYFIGDSKMEAALKAKAKYPERFFHFIRIGHIAMYKWRRNRPKDLLTAANNASSKTRFEFH